VQVRKLQIIMKSYRLRYQRKKDMIDQLGEDDELLSEYSPSELSDIIGAEGILDDDDGRDDEDRDDGGEVSDDM
jgi:hypothetical protein